MNSWLASNCCNSPVERPALYGLHSIVLVVANIERRFVPWYREFLPSSALEHVNAAKRVI
jgi:hypothetical protein